MTRKLMVAAIALAGVTNVMAAGDATQNAASEGMSLRAKIAKTCKITGSDVWYGYRRTKFNFNGRKAWVVEPSVAPAKGMPWTWTMQWAEAFVDRTGRNWVLRPRPTSSA